MWKHRRPSSRSDSKSGNVDSGHLNLSEFGFFGRSKKKSPPYIPSRPDSPSRSPLRPFRSFSRATDRPGTSASGQTDASRSRAPSTVSTSVQPDRLGLGWQPTADTNSLRASFNSRSGRPMAGLMEVDRSRTRRDRTFVGSECAVCEEPLEHTLRGERVLQFSCTHVAHEACFYEYIKEFEGQYCPTCDAPLGLDTSRGGHVLDIEKLSNIVRSVTSDAATQRSGLTTPTPWDQPSARGRVPSEAGNRSYNNRDSRDVWSRRDSRDTGHTGSHRERERVERMTTGSRQQHSRNGSAAGSSGDYDAQQQSNGRRHDYDVQAMESDLGPRVAPTKNPIPAPTVTIRSEFPTLNRSRQQQSLTCLVTVEVPEGVWRPDSDDLRQVSSGTSQPQDEPYGGVVRFPAAQDARSIQYEPQENLDEIAEDLRTRVDNWHGLEFSRFGKLRLHGHMRVGKDRESWQDLECYLFAEMLICIKEKKMIAPQYDDQSKRKPRSSLKGSILIKKHLKSS